MDSLVRGLRWPIFSLLLVGGTHFIAEFVRPELADLVGPAVLMPLYLAAGGWAGLRTLEAGGSFGHGIVAGAILGLLPVVLQLVGFGVLLGREPDVVATSAFFGFVAIAWGGILGSGYTVSREQAPS